MKSCFSIKIPHATTSDTMVQALLMLIQLLVILLGQIITSSIGFGHVIAYFGTGGDRTYFSDEV